MCVVYNHYLLYEYKILIHTNLLIGNLTAAIDVPFLRSNKINYILTVDSCPLPEIILDLRDIHKKYIQGNLISNLSTLYETIKVLS